MEDYGKWPGGQGTPLDAQGCVVLAVGGGGVEAELLPWGPCCPPQVWSEQSQRQLQALRLMRLLTASRLVPQRFLEMVGLGEVSLFLFQIAI